MKLVAGAASDVGRVREGNEDSFLVDDRLALYAVADGMGGHTGGEVASSTSLEALRAAIANGDEIAAGVRAANAAVYEAATGDPDLSGMGTTLTAVVALGGSTLLFGHVGDSRAYRVGENDLAQITEDHSLVEELVREGRLTREQAEVHPQRSIITRALGVEPDVEVDVYSLQVTAGDRILLCSDGLTGMLRDREIAAIARGVEDPRVVADRLVDAANAAGGEDNITVLVLDVLESESEPAVDATALAAYGAVGARDTMVAAPQAASPAAVDVDLGETPRVLDEDTQDELIPESVVDTDTSRPRRVARWVLIAVPVLVVIAIAIGATGWYARHSYYVGLDGDEVVIFKGVPGGVLGWNPTVAERTPLTVSDLPEYAVADLEDGAATGSRATAESYVVQLESDVAEAEAATTTIPRSTTTTSPTRTATTAPEASPTTPGRSGGSAPTTSG